MSPAGAGRGGRSARGGRSSKLGASPRRLDLKARTLATFLEARLALFALGLSGGCRAAPGPGAVRRRSAAACLPGPSWQRAAATSSAPTFCSSANLRDDVGEEIEASALSTSATLT
jgi:hypothetical protein